MTAERLPQSGEEVSVTLEATSGTVQFQTKMMGNQAGALVFEKPKAIPATHFVVGRQVIIKYSHKDAYYALSAHVASLKQKDDVITAVVLTEEPEVKRLQRRDFVRIPFEIAMSFERVHEVRKGRLSMDQIKAQQEAWLAVGALSHQAEVVDLSGGGVAIESKETLYLDDVLLVQFPLPGALIKTIARVANASRARAHGDGVVYGLQFLTLTSDQQDHIVQAVFKKQMRPRD
ncbi:MAG: PilZ domain-containing protein [Deltaproteobacteria bacterium]|nr:PilZ domain-containing protein [Deltaproteobacteria bacterium]